MIARLTASQKSTFRRAYRDACASQDISRALDALYAKYVQLYGLSRSELQESPWKTSAETRKST
jgi:hypothetical protein